MLGPFKACLTRNLAALIAALPLHAPAQRLGPAPHPGRLGTFAASPSRFATATVNAQGLALADDHFNDLHTFNTRYNAQDTLWKNTGVFDPITNDFDSVGGVRVLAPDDQTDLEAFGTRLPGNTLLAATLDSAPDDQNSALLRNRELWLREGQTIPDNPLLPGYRWHDLLERSVARQQNAHALITRVRTPVDQSLPTQRALFVGPHDHLQPVAITGQTHPRLRNGATLAFSLVEGHVAVNAQNTVAFANSFFEPIATGSPTASLQHALVTWSPQDGLQIPVRTGDVIQGVTVRRVGLPAINETGQLAFGTPRFSFYDNTDAETLFRQDPDQTFTRIAAVHDPAPGLPGHTFANVGLRLEDQVNNNHNPPTLDQQGRVDFVGTLRDDQGNVGKTGVWRHDGNALQKIVATGDALGPTTYFGQPSVSRIGNVHQVATSPAGLLAVTARVRFWENAGNSRDMLLLVGHQGDIVIALDEQLADGFGDIKLAEGTNGLDGRPAAVNDLGQVAFQTRFHQDDDWIARVYTPDLAFHADPSATRPIHAWEEHHRWSLGIAPAHVHNVAFNPQQDATLLGPNADTQLITFTLGQNPKSTSPSPSPQPQPQATLQLQPGVGLGANLNIQPNGVLAGSTDSQLFLDDGSINPYRLQVNNAGTIAANGEQPLRLSSLFQQPQGQLTFKLQPNDASPDAVAPLIVDSGALILDGTLRVDAAAKLNPQLGDAFPLLQSQRFRGDFNDVTLPNLPDDHRWWLGVNDQLVMVLEVVTAATLADFDASGSVEQADLDLVLTHWGTDTAGQAPAGWNRFDLRNGSVDQNELDLVLAHWGSAAAPDFRGLSIPEPAFAALFLGFGLLPKRSQRSARL